MPGKPDHQAVVLMPGTWVKLPHDVKGWVFTVCIMGGEPSVSYEIRWWMGNDLKAAYFKRVEFEVEGEAQECQVGFWNGRT